MNETPNRFSSRETLLRIARCPELQCTSTPCRKVIDAQGQIPFEARQTPEPWRGDIENAPLLFVSSNPGYSKNDSSPRHDTSDDQIFDFYDVGFPSVFPKNPANNGKLEVVKFWSLAGNRAAELYGVERNKLKAGHHFAMTEIVHCKSRGEEGMDKALNKCFELHFESILKLSTAEVIVVFGTPAAISLDVARECVVQDKKWGQRNRTVLWLPHPNARKNRTFKVCYDKAAIERINGLLHRHRAL